MEEVHEIVAKKVPADGGHKVDICVQESLLAELWGVTSKLGGQITSTILFEVVRGVDTMEAAKNVGVKVDCIDRVIRRILKVETIRSSYNLQI